VEKSRQMLSYLKSDNVGVLIDSTHWHTSGYDIDDYVGFLRDRLWHIHLRDAAGKDSPTGNYELEKTPGKGEVNFGLLGQTLDKYGYSGNVTLETEYKNYQDVSEVDSENAYAIAHLKSVGWQVPDPCDS
jgi:sugar phosphate isomerase/epimerase